ncbi:sodium-dependent glucose transporter 1A-like [Argiope bruennichi]|uniref:sodium-dependent glucose transporter 1A-like n=1 Tax=Argiope bruennichi TaxID=94029 RepID=UPI0024943138|nr:sodium-dependent glucose transporter 1A-like [Argiope bruennichi]XP_055952736.1 sodium-dependent glucose transporter 1A-like [Argiope bruennichi]XP_055952737.1 sodium-dependent glucose transporter 1A-like [Argiope bruennichi]
MTRLSSKALRIIKTCNLYASCVSSGISMAVVGPCLLDFQELVHTDTEHIAIIFTCRSAGYLAGSLLGGALFDLTEKKQFLMTVFNFLISISMFAVPWSRTVGMLAGWLVLSGFSMGALDTGLNVCCLNLWGKESGPFYQALHFTYSFGSLLAPLIVAPFLGDYHHESLINGTSSFLNETSVEFSSNFNNISTNFNNTSNLHGSEIPSLTYAYLIMGGYSLVVAVSFLAVCIIAPLDVGISKNETTESKQTNFTFVTIVVMLAFSLLFVETGTEIGYVQMVATYSVKGHLHLTSVTGSYVTSSFWAALTISRFSSIFLAIKFSSLAVIVFDLIIYLAGAVVLQFLAASREWALWLATVLLGFGVASLFASVITWVERYITVSNKILGLFASGAAFGEMAIPYVIGYFLEKIPEVLSYVVTASCVLSILLTVILYLILRNKQDKYVEKEGIPNVAFDANAAD